MSIGAVMTIAQEMRRRRDERGRYMDSGYNDDVRPRNRSDTQQPHMRMGDDAGMKHFERDPDRRPYNRMGGVGGFVWDRMPPISPSMGDDDDEDDEEPHSRRPDDWPRGRTDNITSMHDYERQKSSPEHHRKIGYHQEDDDAPEHLDRERAERWVKRMKNIHIKMPYDEVKRRAVNYGIEEDKIPEFYAAFNMIQSDYGMVAKEFGVSTADFYAAMAKAWIMDEDAVEGKTALYEKCIVKNDSHATATEK